MWTRVTRVVVGEVARWTEGREPGQWPTGRLGGRRRRQRVGTEGKLDVAQASTSRGVGRGLRSASRGAERGLSHGVAEASSVATRADGGGARGHAWRGGNPRCAQHRGDVEHRQLRSSTVVGGALGTAAEGLAGMLVAAAGGRGAPGIGTEVPARALVAPEALEVVPANKNLCNGPIGTGTTSIASRNSKSSSKGGPWRSAKGKVVSSKMTCREMMTLLEERSR